MDNEMLEKIKDNIFHLDYSMVDAPYHGFTHEHINGVEFAIEKILEGTGLTLESIIKER